MKTKKRKIRVEFEVNAEDGPSAETFVYRLLRYGFSEISEAEPSTFKAISSWDFVGKKELL